MSEAGLSIQSHTVSHNPLAGLNDDQLMKELSASKNSIENYLGKQVHFLSLPHGVYNEKVIEIAQDTGYQAVCTSEPGYSHAYGKGIPMFKRINVSNRFDSNEFRKILEMSPMMEMSLIASKKMKNFVKKTMGYSTYRKLYKLRYQIKE